MKQSFELSGVNCMHCVARVKKALEPLAESVEVTLSPALAVLTVKEPVSLEKVNKALAEVGDYKAVALN
ncbi:heavy-metal-associated domain-containing protein [Turicimonas muris]|uniref:Copper chaperone n=1 Tax=Turicimonas muris TaxID=1796652 RepID=A0A227KI25_9BURK|nr:heavy-metal-associated domain-containing protein [Turicimonas muris]ANU66603.1 ATPase [Burkholderiales bacterium YL45]OXE47249.1 copper chaperone [Turicimonas muris]QQQ97751.1 heavy-metal-associated domain-containing protein [Turicimonas muris]